MIDYNNPRLSKHRPPKGTRCDMAGPNPDTRPGAALLKGCSNTATLEYLGASSVGETWVCADCAAAKGWPTLEASDE